jgi:hypothetical protein
MCNALAIFENEKCVLIGLVLYIKKKKQKTKKQKKTA